MYTTSCIATSEMHTAKSNATTSYISKGSFAASIKQGARRYLN